MSASPIGEFTVYHYYTVAPHLITIIILCILRDWPQGHVDYVVLHVIRKSHKPNMSQEFGSNYIIILAMDGWTTL